MDEQMPLGFLYGHVDDKGRLKLPERLRQIIEMKAWFLSLEANGKNLRLTSTGEDDQKVEIDSVGRIFIPPKLSANFKSASVHLTWVKDHFLVMTPEEFERLKQDCMAAMIRTTS